MRKLFSFSLLFFNLFFAFAQNPKKLNSSEIYESIQKLSFLGSVLYVAAHPDDENTDLISYFSNHVHAQTAYISLTRGDGGQNLIGPELRELLGVIRTQELIQARRIDGGIQFFTRANDFGFSKTAEETFEIWNKNQVLSDLVYVIRKFQPDVIINRFDHRTPGTTHGHHTASALLSLEAFDLAKDTSKFPDHFDRVKVWKPSRLFFNPSWFFYGSKSAFEKADKSNYFPIEINAYYPTLGISNSEIASKSRSQHSSQGFGATAVRGISLEYLEPLKGGMPKENVFEGIDTTWNRVKGGKKIGEILKKIEKEYDFKNPSNSISDLILAYQLIEKLDDEHWRTLKLNEIKEIIISCAGLFLEAVASTETAIPGEEIQIKIEATNRSSAPFQLLSVMNNAHESPLKNNERKNFAISYKIPQNAKFSSPYWLEELGTLGMYKVENPKLTGLAENPKEINVEFKLKVNGQILQINRPLVYKFNDPTKGESYKPFAIVPPVSVHVEEKVLIFNDDNSKKVAVKVKSFGQELKGNLRLKAPKNWKIYPQNISVSIPIKREEKTYWFEVSPPNEESESELIPEIEINGKIWNKQLIEIKYDHIPEQKVLLSGESKIVKLIIGKSGESIAYIHGAGDAVPENLRQIGYRVDILAPSEITTENLKKYEAVVLGIRAFNVLPELAYKNKVLFEFVKNGGNLIVQYNTNGDLVTQEIAPFPLKLSRDRVTDEFSEVKFTNSSHPALNFPNKISQKDFEGWVQERGLYFPNEWSSDFSTLFSMHDKGENPLEGSVVIAKYGKGYYVYTGLSFFRELPAGVPGAYRLLANFLSLGNSNSTKK